MKEDKINYLECYSKISWKVEARSNLAMLRVYISLPGLFLFRLLDIWKKDFRSCFSVWVYIWISIIPIFILLISLFFPFFSFCTLLAILFVCLLSSTSPIFFMLPSFYILPIFFLFLSVKTALTSLNRLFCVPML